MSLSNKRGWAAIWSLILFLFRKGKNRIDQPEDECTLATMKRDQLIKELKGYFTIKELVCDHTYAKWGEQSWQFLDTDFLNVILTLRKDILKVPMTCNSSVAHQRGLRCNMCELVHSKTKVYLSSHILGKAGDFDVKGMSAEEARKIIIANSSKLPCNIRMEGDVTWLHIDVLPQYGIDDKVYVFKA